MSEEIRIPYGQCEITYGDTKLKYLAEAVEFNAVPEYEKYSYGQFQIAYLLKNYTVTLDLELQEETYENMKLSFAGFKEDELGGMYDDPSNVDTTGKLLTIHPLESGNSKEFDLTIFRAIVDPEHTYKRVYGKEKDTISVRFIGLPTKPFGDGHFKSAFYIGDAEKAGVI
jgi:hypothetical protein